MARFCLIVLLLTSFLAYGQSTMVYRYWDLGASQTRDQYQLELLRLALEKTRPSHGDYQIIRVQRKLTSLRASREVNRGDLINIEAAPNWTPDEGSPDLKRDKRISIKVPILKGLLGYRRLVIRKADLEKFAAITDPSQLRVLAAGQGRDWGDVAIYRENNYSINAEADYHKLFAMLIAKRFDYIPLSAIEAEEFIQRFGGNSQDVVIAPNILLYYPFPVLFQVSPNQPALAERVERGLSLAQRDGSMDRLFEHYFADDLAKLRAVQNQVFVLSNKRASAELELEKPLLTH